MKKQKKHEEKLPRTPYEGTINVGDRVVFWMPASRKNTYPVGGEVNAISTNGGRVELRKLSVCNDPDICMEIDRTWVVLNKGQHTVKNGGVQRASKPYNVWIVVNGQLHDKVPHYVGKEGA